MVVGPRDLLVTAWQRMKPTRSRSLPVMDGDRIVGIVDESDVLLHVYGDEVRFRDPVSTGDGQQAGHPDVRSPVESLLPVFDRATSPSPSWTVTCFIGPITGIDLLNRLRRRVQ